MLKVLLAHINMVFFPGRSLTSNLLNFSEYCITELYSGGQVDVIYTDIEDYELA